MPCCLYDFVFTYPCFLPTALLICIENTFWDINEDNDFVELFKKSFKLYVDSGLREKTEREIEVLRNEQGEFLVTKDFNAKFYKFIVDHYLRKFHFISIFTWHI